MLKLLENQNALAQQKVLTLDDCDCKKPAFNGDVVRKSIVNILSAALARPRARSSAALRAQRGNFFFVVQPLVADVKRRFTNIWERALMQKFAHNPKSSRLIFFFFFFQLVSPSPRARLYLAYRRRFCVVAAVAVAAVAAHNRRRLSRHLRSRERAQISLDAFVCRLCALK